MSEAEKLRGPTTPTVGEDSADDPLAYYMNYLARCWEARQYYKDEENKLLYWVGTAFIALVAASGLLGGIRQKGAVFSFGLVHVLAFHLIFTVAWYYYLYKKLNTGLFGRLGEKVEGYVEKTFGVSPPGGFPAFFKVKTRFLGRPSSNGRGLSRIANTLIIFVYIGTVSYPVFRGSLSSQGVVVNWEFLIPLGTFFLLTGIGHWLYKVGDKRIEQSIEQCCAEQLSPLRPKTAPSSKD